MAVGCYSGGSHCTRSLLNRLRGVKAGPFWSSLSSLILPILSHHLSSVPGIYRSKGWPTTKSPSIKEENMVKKEKTQIEKEKHVSKGPNDASSIIWAQFLVNADARDDLPLKTCQ